MTLFYVEEESTDVVGWKVSVHAPVPIVCPSSRVWKSSLSWQMLSLILLMV